MKIRYLLMNAYGVGGAIRTVVNQANALAGDHDVEIASVFRGRDQPAFDIDPRIRLVPLVDLRGMSRSRSVTRVARLLPARVHGRLPMAWLRALSSTEIHRGDSRFADFSQFTDRALVGYLRGLHDGILVSTRPSLNLIIARHTPADVVTIGQDHMNLRSYSKDLQAHIAHWYRQLDAVAVLTRADEAEYSQILAGAHARLVRIPNPLPSLAAPVPAPSLDAPVVIAAGRLTGQKGYDRLIDAYASVAADHPRSQLRIFGTGPARDELHQQIHDLHLYNHVFLMGHTGKLASHMANAAMFAVSSRYEGFPMVILEAMQQGVPVVAFDCHTGPGEMITDGYDGRLVPAGDVAGFASAITDMLADLPGRRVMGAHAAESVRRFEMCTVLPQWEQLFADLLAANPGISTPARDIRPDRGIHDPGDTRRGTGQAVR